jgi:hypothetical protein
MKQGLDQWLATETDAAKLRKQQRKAITESPNK